MGGAMKKGVVVMRIGAVLVGMMAVAGPMQAQDAPAFGQIYVAQTFDAWQLRCVTPAEGAAERCNMYQLLRNAANDPVAEVSLFSLPQGGQAVAGANVTVPLETLLTQQLTISVGENAARVYPFSYCNAGGCVARVGLTQEDIDLMSAGSSATLRLVPAAAPEQEVLLTMSLAGFTAAFAAASAAP